MLHYEKRVKETQNMPMETTNTGFQFSPNKTYFKQVSGLLTLTLVFMKIIKKFQSVMFLKDITSIQMVSKSGYDLNT